MIYCTVSTVVFAITLLISAPLWRTVNYSDDFSDGIDPEHWTLVSNQPLYTCDDSGGDVLLKKPEGGGGWGQNDFFKVCFSPNIIGDFDISVDYSDAVVDWNSEHWGNELALEVGFGHHYFQIARGDGEDGDWVGTWVDPPGVGSGFFEASMSGRFRIARTRSIVTAYFNERVVHRGNYSAEQVTHLCLSLKNNFATDALSVRFDNFSLVGDGYSPARQVARIEASDGEGGNEFGAPIALNGDTLVIAAQEADYEFFPPNRPVSGAVYIFDRDSGNPAGWSEVAKISQPEGELVDEFGKSLAIHGTTLVVASWRACTERSLPEWYCEAGAVYLFEQDQGGPGNWGFVKRFIAEGTWDADRFGSSVSIEGDFLVVGSSNSGSGKAFVYEKNQGGLENWGQVAELVGSDTEDGDRFGTALSISGNLVVVGATRTDDACPGEFQCWSGSAYVFERNYGGPDNWGEVKKISPDDLVQYDRFGRTAVIDGDTVMVETMNQQTESGATYVFHRHHGGVNNWGLVVKSEPTSPFHGKLDFRGDLALIGDSGTAIARARNQGGVDAWGEVARLSRRTGWSEGGFPSSLAVGDGGFVVGAVSAFKDVDGIWRGENVGAVYIFKLNQSEPPPVLRLRRSAGRRLRP
jgi:hypothetical protein